jgi:putative ABC transport system substrate-binding protein
MRRREFITLLGGAAAWPASARAQQPKPVIGFLRAGFEVIAEDINAFRHGLANLGYVEGRNVAIEYRLARGDNARLPGLSAELVRERVAVIVAAGGTVAALAAKAATRDIPIVFTIGSDPVENGLVASLSRPEGNATGAALLITAVAAKRIELLHELLPRAGVIGLLTNPGNAVLRDAEVKEAQEAARILGLRIVVFELKDVEIEAAFAAAAGSAGRRPPRQQRSQPDGTAAADCNFGSAPRAASDLPVAGLCADRRPHELRTPPRRRLPAGGRLCRTHPPWCKTLRSSGPTGDPH